MLVRLAIASLCLVLLFSARPVRLAEVLAKNAASVATSAPSAAVIDLAKVEHQKVIDEIRFRIEIEDNWYHYKFILVGALAAFFLGWFRRGQASEDTAAPVRDTLEATLFTDSTCALLAAATLVAIAIDIHIRNNMIVIQQLALWIAHYAEPLLTQRPFSSTTLSGFLPWEQFVRVSDGTVAGMHQDDLYGLALYPHLHFLTWVIYVVYLVTFHKVVTGEGPPQPWIQWGGFALVHLSLAAFTWVGHTGPTYLEFKVVPWIDWWARGWIYPFCYEGIWLILVLINVAPYRRQLKLISGPAALRKM